MTRAEPLVELRQELEAARRAGIDFDTAWLAGTATALNGIPPVSRTSWTVALGQTKEGWRDAYDGRGSEMLLLARAACEDGDDL